MRPRPPTVRLGMAARIQAHQEDRLIRIARGELEPGCARERLFLQRARRAGRIRVADFMLPAVLYRAEQSALEAEAEDAPVSS